MTTASCNNSTTPVVPTDPLAALIGGFGSPSLLLESFIPGYSIISGILVNSLGLDISRLVPIVGVLFALSKLYDYLTYQIKGQILQYFACSIQISSELDAYYNVSRFLSDKKNIGKRSSDLVALSQFRTDGGHIDPESETNPYETDSGAKRRLRKPQEYESKLESYQWFWYNGRLFIWYRQRDARSSTDYQLARALEGKLYCFSPTTTPLKQLVEDAAAYQDARNAGFTKIYRPTSAKQRSFDVNWRSASARPSRPLGTVIMSKETKNALVADIEQYLLAATRKWYSQRGIPYRRGYLFYGAPGTGKTSLSFALAGLLDLSIYCVSLADKSMTEDDLFELFSNLPASCLVLLEDIDTAGLQRRDDKIMANEESKDDVTSDDQEQKKNTSDGSGRVTLSGLLNVIDGVASHEGRVLIMTTNDADSLDPALLRPGRIDVKTHFPKSSKEDARDLFIQTFMDYDGDSIDEKQEVPAALRRIAEQFAEQIPNAKFTPAELQGFLLLWKNSKPEVAVANAKAWAEGTVSGDAAALSMMKGTTIESS